MNQTSNSRIHSPESIVVHDKPRAPFRKIKDYIVENINSGEWPPETRIPSENNLVNAFGVSRSTVHRAFREMISEGYLIGIQGIGTFVAKHKQESPLFNIRPISDEIRQRGEKYSADIHLLTKDKANSELASALDIPEGSLVFRSIIVHRSNGRPVQLADRYVNPLIAPDYLKQDFTTITPSEYLFQLGPLTEAEHYIEAQLPDKKAQKLLEAKAGEPCLVIQRRTWINQIVATKAKLTYSGSRFILGGRFKPSSLAKPLVA